MPPSERVPVCLDVSALITLFKLGLLNTLADSFSDVVLSDRVVANVAQDSVSLLPHQRTSREGATHIRELVVGGKIAIVDIPRSPHIDEHKHEPKETDAPLNLLRKALVDGGLLDVNCQNRALTLWHVAQYLRGYLQCR